ncbi:ABC transporter substrate-binding protein [Streptomyces sp. NBC_00258]|uniref:ABC transporter substrate-binding protein n=1 Tax=Streptomyces sp. NBC_00258 TaxID=2903642 RepID=UPI002E28540F|nr:extracellular solute-binding protein [Streptomyces sp. NBC_00258]
MNSTLTDNPQWEQLYQAALREGGALSLYGGGPVTLYTGAAAAFEKAFPGITVDITATFSNILAPKIDAQIAAENLEVDLAIFQTVQDFYHWKQRSVLTAYQPDGSEHIPAAFKDTEGTYHGLIVHALAYTRNTDTVPDDLMPTVATDFLDPLFRGRAITTYPHDDDITLYLYATLAERYGWDFVADYVHSGAQFIRGHLGVADRIAAGDADVSMDSIVALTMADIAAGRPTAVHVPQDVMPVWPQTAAIFNNCPHPSTAKLYMSWFLAAEQQATLGTWSPRADLPAPTGLRPLAEYPLADQFLAFMLDDDRVQQARGACADLIGPVVGEPNVGTS